MSRKFKVWDSEYKRFNIITDFFINQNGELWVAPLDNKVQKANQSLIIVWSTGQTDKSGVEIYEGDIRRCSVATYVVEVGPFVFTDPDGIKYHLSGIHKKWISRFEDDISPFDIIRDSNDEHIGNKFENKGLLDSMI